MTLCSTWQMLYAPRNPTAHQLPQQQLQAQSASSNSSLHLLVNTQNLPHQSQAAASTKA
jgi:hypothetical protein